MKKRNTFLKSTGVTVIAFVLLVTPAMLASNTFARVDESAKVGSILIQNGPTYNLPGIVGDRKPEVGATPSIGSYELFFYASRFGVLEEVSSMPVLSGELILRAFVEDSLGVPAQNGTVTFEYCSYKSLPPGDIDRTDEAPKEACDARIASWRRLRSVDIGNCPRFGSGSACFNFGVVQIPRVVGFRFRFRDRTRDIDPGVSEAANFTWTAAL